MKRVLQTLCIVAFLLPSVVKAQFKISYPVGAGGMIVCQTTADLTVRVDVIANSNTNKVTIDLSPGVEYVPGSVSKTGGTSTLTIAGSNISNLNSPVFAINPNALVPGNRIEFKIKRGASCTTYSWVREGNVPKDTVTIAGSAGTVIENSASINQYNVTFSTLTLQQPSTVSNTSIGGVFTRTFKITNGSQVNLNTVHFYIHYPGKGIEMVELRLGASTVLTPWKTSGDTLYYTLTGSQLGSDNLLTNGEALNFTEKFKVKTCGANTLYGTGWGCSADPKKWCQAVTGSGNITMASGVPNFSEHSNTNLNYVNMCTPWSMRTTYKNTGTGNSSSATMFDVTLQKGYKYPSTLYLLPLPSIYKLENARVYNPSTGTYSAPIPTVLSGGIYSYNLNNFFTTDPDGPGVGLEDIDGDGFYDDLPPGNTVTLEILVSLDCEKYPYTCGANITAEYIGGQIQYYMMCDRIAPQTSYGMIPTGSANSIIRRTLSAQGYIPANIQGNVVFNTQVGFTYFNYSSSLRTDKSRYQYVITLPSGTTASNIKWVKAKYPAGTPVAHTGWTQVGNVLTVTSPDNNMGWTTFDLVYNCSAGSNFNISYKIYDINDITTGCSCIGEIGCGTLSALAHCPNPCPAGPSVLIPIVERADNSLGWTDYTMATRQTRANISAYDLSKALYLDEITIIGDGVQHGNYNNLYIELKLDKIPKTFNNKLTPLDIYVEIVRNNVVVKSQTISTFDQSTSTDTEQTVIWNATSALPSGGIRDNDVIRTKSRYKVAVNDGLPTHDVQSGGSWRFYNIDGTGNKVSCNRAVPEMYLVGLISIDGHNPANTSSCDLTTMGTFHNIALRFDPAGMNYKNEFRPGGYVYKYEITVPPAFELVNTRFEHVTSTTTSIIMTPNSIIGNTYTYNNPGTWLPYSITVTNDYGARIIPSFYPTCASASNTAQVIGKYYIKEFYYNYADPSVTQYEKSVVWQPIPIYSKPPSMTMSDQTGTVQAYQSTHSWTVRMTNTSTERTPFTWLAIKNATGVNIVNVKDAATGVVIPPINYSEGKWYKINDAGLANGTSNDYIIEFSYTTCTSGTVQVIGGWNCSSYPADPTKYTCGNNPLSLKFNVLPSGVELTNTVSHTGNVDLCSTIHYEYVVNSTQGANTLDNKVRLYLPTGLELTGNFQAEYPLGSGNWATITPTVSGPYYTYNLTAHPAFPATGLPGIFSDGGNANRRAIKVRFDLKTNCDFASGHYFRITNFAQRPCGAPVANNNTTMVSAPIGINGVIQPYSTSDNILVSDFSNCYSQVAINVNSLIIGGTTTANAQAVIELPLGFHYIPNSLSFGESKITISTNLEGKEVLTIKLPENIGAGNTITYNLKITADNSVAQGTQTIYFENIEKLGSLACGPIICDAIKVITGSKTLTFDVQKPSVSLTSTNNKCYGGNTGTASATASGGTAPYTYKWNTNATTKDITGLVAGTYTVTITDANGCTATNNVNVGQPAQPIVVNITSTTNPICQGASTTLTASATGGTPGYTYSWSPSQGLNTTTGATVIANPTATTTYTVLVTDANNCTESKSITVTVNQIPVCSITGNNGPVCPSSSLTYQGPAGMNSYSWSISGNANITGSTTSQVVSIAVGSTENTSFTLILTLSKDGCQSACQKTINIAQSTAISAHPTNASYCQNGAATAMSVTASGYGALTYQWYRNTTNSNTGGTLISGATSSSYIPPTSNSGTSYYYVEVSSECGKVKSNPAMIVVNKAVTCSLSSQKVTCYGGNNGTVTVTVLTGTPNYKIELYSNNNLIQTANNVTSPHTFEGLSEGFYSVKITDSNNCSTDN